MPDMDILFERLQKTAPALELRQNEPMARHTTFRVGGPAALMALPRTEGEARLALREAHELGIAPFFLGNGSNLLVADGGYPGFIVKLSGGFDDQREVNGELWAGSAQKLSQLARAAWGRRLTGLEFAAGIPGTVGGAVTMNAGAYGGEMARVVSAVRVMDRAGDVEEIPNNRCDFAYRHSAFSGGERLILSARFALTYGDPAAIKARMDNLSARRKEKQPLEFPSAGSTFKRPAGHYAAALIERCGLKGLRVGGAQVSEKHAGFIINTGGATCADILALMDRVRERVFQETGVTLEPEVRYLG